MTGALWLIAVLGPQAGLPEARLIEADRRLASTNSISARYVIEDVYRERYKDLRQTSVVQLQRPGRLRLEVTRARRVDAKEAWKDTGNNTLAVVDAGQRTDVFFHPHSTQVRRSETVSPKIDEAVLLAGFFKGGKSPAQQIAAARRDGSLGAVTDLGPNGISYSIGKRSFVAQIGPEGLVSQLTIEDASRRTRIVLEKLEINPTLTEGLFAYRVPAGALPLERGGEAQALEVGDLAPELRVVAANGKPLTLSSLRGRPVAIKFWATWCWPCNQSMPEFNSTARRYKSQDIPFLAVAIKDTKKGFDSWLREHRAFADIRFAFDEPVAAKAAKDYKVSVTPTTFVVDADGRITAILKGFDGPSEELDIALRSLR